MLTSRHCNLSRDSTPTPSNPKSPSNPEQPRRVSHAQPNEAFNTQQSPKSKSANQPRSSLIHLSPSSIHLLLPSDASHHPLVFFRPPFFCSLAQHNTTHLAADQGSAQTPWHPRHTDTRTTSTTSTTPSTHITRTRFSSLLQVLEGCSSDFKITQESGRVRDRVRIRVNSDPLMSQCPPRSSTTE